MSYDICKTKHNLDKGSNGYPKNIIFLWFAFSFIFPVSKWSIKKWTSYLQIRRFSNPSRPIQRTQILQSSQSHFCSEKILQISKPYCDFSPIMKIDNREWERFWFGSHYSNLKGLREKEHSGPLWMGLCFGLSWAYTTISDLSSSPLCFGCSNNTISHVISLSLNL